MSQQEKGAIVIIFDVGKSVSTPESDDGKTFFEKSRDCISWILRRKILSMNQDLLSILVTGTDEEGESLDDIDVTLCRNISIKYDFQMASWDMLEYIEKDVKPKDKMSDWVGSLSVAIEKLKILEETYKLSSKTVVVFSDLAYTFTEAVSSVLNDIRSHGIDVNVIGCEYFSDISGNVEVNNGEPTAKKIRLEDEISDIEKEELISGDRLLYVMWNAVGDLITICSFDSALRHLSSYVKKKVRAMPWNCVMDIGDFKISVQVFKKVDRKSQYCPEWKYRRSEDDEFSQSEFSEVKRDKIMYYNHSDSSETKEIHVEEDDVIAGYRYGASVIPFSDEDKCVMGYKPGKKCFSILGFTHNSNIPYYALVGEGCYIVVPRDKDKHSEVALSALIQAMSQTETVAVVRRVYSDDRGLSLGVLYPLVEEQGESNYKECLIFIELVFYEDIKVVQLPRLRRIEKKITEEQYNLIDNLIDELDLMKCESGGKDQVGEELDLSSRHGVKNQFFSHCIVHKALYPNDPLPKELPQHFTKLLAIPDLICKKGEKFDEKLRELFSVKVKGNEPVPPDNSTDAEKSDDFSSSYTFDSEKENTPENCFRKLFDSYGYPPAEEIRNLLELLAKTFKEEELVEEFLKLTREARKKTIENYTDDYNYWMRRLRIYLGTEKQLEKNYWKRVLEDNLGLITTDEHSDSYTTKEDADFFINSLKTRDDTEAEKMEITKEEEEAINLLF